MNKALQIGKRALSVGVTVSTIAWSIGLATFVIPMAAKAADLSSGDLIKASLPAVYYYGGDGKRYVFPNEKSYKTWYADFSTVKTITDAELAAITIGGNATYRPGVKMVKITTDPKVYAVAKGGVLRWVASEAVAVALFGANWNTQIDDVPDAFFTNYTIGAQVNSASDFDKAAEMAAGSTINADKGLAAGPVSTGGGALQVSLASDNPAGGTVVSDTTGEENGQRATMLKIRLTSNGSAAKVTGLKLRRSGISADSDADNLYLYDGASRLANSQSVSNGVVTFSDASGLLTVPAGGAMDVTVKVDLNKDAASGKTMGYSLAAADVTSDASSVSGSASGNLFTIAAVTDLGQVEIGNVSPSAATTADPQDNYELWRFKLDAVDQNMLVQWLTLTNVGSVGADDLQNLSLWDGAVQLGSTASRATNGKLNFDLRSMANGGLKMLSGTTKQLSLRGDVKSGTNRTYRWTVQNSTDVMIMDLNYNVETVAAADGSDSFSVIQAGGATTINTGNLTVQVHPDSPSSNVPDGATNVTLARWNLSAAGEDVQVDTLDISCGSNDAANILKNVKVTLAGAQVGTTMSSLTCDGASPAGTDFSFGNTFVIPVAVTKELAFNADLTDATIGSGDTIVANLVAGASNAKGRTSLTAISTSAVSGRTVTVSSGTLSVSKNASLANYTASRPLGVTGSTGVRIGSFVITGGAEPSDVTGITLKDDVDTTSDSVTLADYFINLKLKHTGTQLGSTIGTLTDTDSTTYEFTLSPAVRLGVGETYTVDIYADVKSTFGAAVSNLNTDDVGGEVIMDKVTATGITTSSDTSYSTDINLQDMYLATNGMLRVTVSADTPTDAQMTLGSTEQVFAVFKLAEESNAEDILVTKFVVADGITSNTAVPFNATGTLSNLKLFKGSTLLGTVAALDSSTHNTGTPLAVFDLSGLAGGGLLVAKGTADTVLTVKADLTPWSLGGSSSTTHRLFVMGGGSGSGPCAGSGDYDCTTTGLQEAVTANGKGSGFSISSTNATATSGLVIGSSSGATQAHANGNVMDALRAKLTVASAADSPSGLQTKSSEATVAKFVFTNASPGGYTATLKQLNLDINQSGISITAARTLRVYKDSIDAVNQLASTSFNSENYSDTQLTDANFTDTEVAAGQSRTLIVTLDTSDGSIGSNDTLSVGIQTGATGGQPAVLWSDGAALTLTEVNSLPLAGKTLSY